VTEIMVRDVLGFVAAFKRRIRELGITYETADHLSGLPAGYTAKIFAGMKNPGPIAIAALCSALAVGFVMIVDEEQATRVRDRWTPRKRPLFGEDGPTS
jgi:hypothetical protein